MRNYLDTCAINRMTDERVNGRVASEAIRIATLISHVVTGSVFLIASEGVVDEGLQNSDRERRRHVEKIVSMARTVVEINPEIDELSDEYFSCGMDLYEADHLVVHHNENTECVKEPRTK